MPKLSPEKLNPGHDAAVRRMLAAWSGGKKTVEAKAASPMKNGSAAAKPASVPLRKH